MVGLSEERLAKLAEGRAQSLVVNAYLRELRAYPSRPGRPRTADNARREHEVLAKRIAGGQLMPSVELLARQRLRDLDEEIALLDARAARMKRLEAEFLVVCRAYSERQGLDREAWAEMGVPARVLRQCYAKKPK